MDMAAQPIKDKSALQNLTDASTNIGLYSVAGTSINKAANAPADLRLGLATYGIAGTSLTLPGNPRNLGRDFFHAYVVDLKPFLIGRIAPTFLQSPRSSCGASWWIMPGNGRR